MDALAAPAVAVAVVDADIAGAAVEADSPVDVVVESVDVAVVAPWVPEEAADAAPIILLATACCNKLWKSSGGTPANVPRKTGNNSNKLDSPLYLF